MKIPVVNALIEKREKKRRREKTRQTVKIVISVVAGVIVLFSFVASLVMLIERWVQNREQRKQKFAAFMQRLREKIPFLKAKPVYCVDNFGDQDIPEEEEDPELF